MQALKDLDCIVFKVPMCFSASDTQFWVYSGGNESRN